MIVITFDVDWVPGFVLESVMQRIEEAGIKGTFFCTSPLKFRCDSSIELAIHPNFMPDSTQGSSENHILANLLKWYPAAVGLRTHRLYWHSGLQDKLIHNNIRYDSSILMPFHPFLEPIRIGDFTRFACWWSDNIHMNYGLPFHKIELPNLDKPGLKIFDFHPIHIFLNTNNLDTYRRHVKCLQPLEAQAFEDLSHHREPGYGIGTFFDEICEYITRNQYKTHCLKELLP